MDPSRFSPWIAPIFLAHLGCPHRCIFCNQGLIGPSFSPPSPAEVRSTLEACFLARKRPVVGRRQIAFYGGSFTRMPRRFQEAYLEACGPYLRLGLVDSVRLSTRPDEVSGDDLAWLAGRGVRTVELGAQSLSDRVLAESRRGYTVQQVRDAAERVRRAGLELGVQIMVGLPGESKEAREETVEGVCRLRPDFVRIYPLLVLEQTALAAAMRAGAYVPLGLEEAVSICVDMVERFERESIPVIRIGLQGPIGGRDGSPGVLAGPYHPAFGHLVRSAVFFRKVVAFVLGAVPAGARLCLCIHPNDRPLLVGHRRGNLEKLRDLLGGRQVRILEDPTRPRGTVGCRVEGPGSPGESRGDHPNP